MSDTPCQNIVSKDPLKYCENEPAQEYELEFEHEGDTVSGTGHFCEQCKPPERDLA